MELDLAYLPLVLFELAYHSVCQFKIAAVDLSLLCRCSFHSHVPESTDEVLVAAGQEPVAIWRPTDARYHFLMLSNVVDQLDLVHSLGSLLEDLWSFLWS